MGRRMYTPSARKRNSTPIGSAPVRLTRSVMANLDGSEDSPQTPERHAKTPAPKKSAGRSLMARANMTSRKKADSGSGNESSEDEVADDEDDESSVDDEDDGDDESDQPAAFAPSYGNKRATFRQAGQLAEYKRLFRSEDPVLYEDPHELFAGAIDEDEEDDDLYEAVDEISDEDEQVDGSFPSNDADYTTADFPHGQDGSSFTPEDEAELILGQVDGLSNYGFGNDIESDEVSEELSVPSEDGNAFASAERHVHFGSDVEPLNAYGSLASPSLTRALLPSALPLDHHVTRSPFRQIASVTYDDPYDSDATEVTSQPPSPVRAGSTSFASSPVTSQGVHRHGHKRVPVEKRRKGKTSRRNRGPPRGIFNVDKDKCWAILDVTGKKILQIPAANTNRHSWLEEMSQSSCTPSTSASPMNRPLKMSNAGSLENVSASSGDRPTLEATGPDAIVDDESDQNAVLTRSFTNAASSSATYFAPGLQLVGGDYAVSPEPASDVEDGQASPITAQREFNLEDFLEDLSSDESDDAESGLPLFTPADDNLTADNDDLSHLNNVNVTAFRRYADTLSASRPETALSYDLQMSPMIDGSFVMPTSPLKSPRSSHKRKISTTPYEDDKIYGDVHPVERKVISATKRRRVAT